MGRRGLFARVAGSFTLGRFWNLTAGGTCPRKPQVALGRLVAPTTASRDRSGALAVAQRTACAPIGHVRAAAQHNH